MYEEFDAVAIDNPFGLSTAQLAALGVGTAAAIGLAFYLLSPAPAEAAGLSGDLPPDVPPADPAQIEAIAKAMYPKDFEEVRWVREKPDGYLARILLKKPLKLQGLGPQVELLVALDYSDASVVKSINAFDSDAYKKRVADEAKLRDVFQADAEKAGVLSPEKALANLLAATDVLLIELEQVRLSPGNALGPNSAAVYTAWRNALLKYQEAAKTKAAQGLTAASWIMGSSGSKSYRPGSYQLSDIGDTTKGPYKQSPTNAGFDSTLVFGYVLGVPQTLFRATKVDAAQFPDFTGSGYVFTDSNAKTGYAQLLPFFRAWTRDTGRRKGTAPQPGPLGIFNAKDLGYTK